MCLDSPCSMPTANVLSALPCSSSCSQTFRQDSPTSTQAFSLLFRAMRLQEAPCKHFPLHSSSQHAIRQIVRLEVCLRLQLTLLIRVWYVKPKVLRRCLLLTRFVAPDCFVDCLCIHDPVLSGKGHREQKTIFTK